MEKRFYYLLRLQFLGFRYHGWQKQKTGHKTIQEMLEKTLQFILGEGMAKALAASRTDAMVSADDFLCKVTTKVECNPEKLFEKLNFNLPQDIKVKSLETSTEEFRVINEPKIKTYHYYFSNTKDVNPLSAPYIINYYDELNFELMHEAVAKFKGHHSFEKYCYRPNENKIFKREILEARIFHNDILTANFFPKESFIFEVKGEGFLRHQVRLMMGALILVGNGQLSMEEFEESLLGKNFERIPLIAPASGLRLYKTEML